MEGAWCDYGEDEDDLVTLSQNADATPDPIRSACGGEGEESKKGTARSRPRGKFVSDHIACIGKGDIWIRPEFIPIIDSEPFQRLADISQLGASYWVYRGASHKRLEHSMGVYHLARVLVNKFARFSKLYQEPKSFKIWEQRAIEMAALCHDIGHGPWSHVFDTELRRRLAMKLAAEAGGDGSRELVADEIKKWSHERMACAMLDYLFDDYQYAPPGRPGNTKGLRNHPLVRGLWGESTGCPGHDEDERRKAFLDFVKDLIQASDRYKKGSAFEEWKKKPNAWMYEIVSNPRNSIDVDKFDYLVRDSHHTVRKDFPFVTTLMDHCRVIDNQICYWSKHDKAVYDLFTSRADMHKDVYTNPKVKGIELLLVDILMEANELLKLEDYMVDAAKFVQLHEWILHRIKYNDDEATGIDLSKARRLVERLQRRELYIFIGEVPIGVPDYTPEEERKLSEEEKGKMREDKIDKFQAQEPEELAQGVFDCFQRLALADTSHKHDGVKEKIKKEHVLVSKCMINFCQGKHDPIERVRFFDKHDSPDSFHVQKHQVWNFTPDSFRHFSLRVYLRGEYVDEYEDCRGACKAAMKDALNLYCQTIEVKHLKGTPGPRERRPRARRRGKGGVGRDLTKQLGTVQEGEEEEEEEECGLGGTATATAKRQKTE